MRYTRWFCMLCVTAMLSLQTGWAQATPEVGWWWNANESGRGFFVESQNGIMYLAGYFYESDGRATWLVAGGPNTDPYSYSGRLLAYQGGQTLFGDYTPPTGSIDAGAVSVNFTDDKHGTITWPGGTVSIEREIFDGRTAAFQANSGWWWNPAESGRGFSLEVQGENLFVVSFMYDDNGKPVWYYAAGKMSSPTTYEGALLQFANGQTMTGTYHPPTAPITVGQLALAFTATDEATLTISDDGVQATGEQGLSKRGRSKMIKIKREFADKPNALPDRYEGDFRYTAQYESEYGHGTWTVNGHVTWIDNNLTAEPLAPGLNFPGKFAKDYVVSAGSITASWTATTGVGGATCTANGANTVPFPPDGSLLQVSGYGQYVGEIRKAMNVTITITCPSSSTTTTNDFEANLPIKGPLLHGAITGALLDAHLPNITQSGVWNFQPVR